MLRVGCFIGDEDCAATTSALLLPAKGRDEISTSRATQRDRPLDRTSAEIYVGFVTPNPTLNPIAVQVVSCGGRRSRELVSQAVAALTSFFHAAIKLLCLAAPSCW